MAGKNDHPCVSVCEFDGRTGWCVGCGCTLGEIRGWRKLTPFRRTALRADLDRRIRLVGERSSIEPPASKRDGGRKSAR